MIKSLRSAISNKFVLFTLLFLVVTDLAVLFNIPILRQFSGFFFLTFIPGFLILTSLKLNKLGLMEKIVVTVGLSVAFVMLFGLLINFLFIAAGNPKPLSTLPLMTSFGFATLILAFIAYKANKGVTLAFPTLGLTTREKALLIVPSLFPLLSIAGMRLMNITSNNSILMFLLFLIPAYVIFVSFYRSKFQERAYPGMLWLTGISLVLLVALRSNHVTGSDTLESFYVFQTTLDKQHWSITSPGLIASLLSISLLPSIYQVFLNMNAEFLFKVLYPILISIMPLVVYTTAKKYIGAFYAFLASFFLMSQFVFLWSTSTPQTNMSILFFAMTVMVLFHEDIDEFTRRLIAIIFAASSLVSHYSTSYIFFFLFFLTWLGRQIIPHIIREAAMPVTTENQRQSQPRLGVTLTFVLLFFTLLFFWFSQITIVGFDIGVGLIYKTFTSLSQSFLLEAKGPTVAAAIGEGISTVPQQIRFVWSWFTVAFIAIGILATVVKYRGMVAITGAGDSKPTFLNSKFEMEYLVLSLVCSAILVAAVVLPYISVFYSVERTYFQIMSVLSPFFIIGGIVVAGWLRARPHWIILPVLIPFFMCTTGTMNQILGVPTSLVLNSSGYEYEYIYISEEESYAAKWLAQNGVESYFIHTDYDPGPRVLAGQGKIPMDRVRGSLIADYRNGKDISGYLYLFYPAVIRGEAALPKGALMNIRPTPDLLASRDKVYTAGPTDIYYSR